MTVTPKSDSAQKKFNLLSWFSFFGLVVVVLISVITSYLLSQFLEEHLIRRDAAVLKDFVARISQHHDPRGYFSNSYARNGANLNDFFNDIAHMPDVARINAFDTDFKIVWSSDSAIIGQSFPDNHELREALEGDLVYELGDLKKVSKKEHLLLTPDLDWFVENYIPIQDPDTQQIVGVVEIYRIPVALSKSISQGRKLVWSSVLIGGLILFLSLFWVIRHGQQLINSQQQKLMSQTRLATIGEMSSSVAHSIRNPIASIRSSAELVLEDTQDSEITESMQDIISEVDRFDGWIKELLTFTSDAGDISSTADIQEAIQSSLGNYAERIERQGISIQRNLPEGEMMVKGDPILLIQVLNSLISNAMDAMPHGGQLIIELITAGQAVHLSISDTGFGIPEDRLSNLFDPLVTHKNGGLGIGLALARQIIQRYRGSISINSTVGSGTTVIIILPISD